MIDEAKRVHRLRRSCESRSYEIGGIPLPADLYIKKDELGTALAGAAEIQFEDEFSGPVEKRLSTRGRVYFLNASLDAPLALGQLSPLGIVSGSHRLAFTTGLIAKRFGAKVSDPMLADAGYVHSEGDGHWWAPTGSAMFPADAAGNFYSPIGSRDVFGNESSAEYDKYKLLAVSTTDAIGNRSTAINDYRTLSPSVTTDPNLNRSMVKMDELGFVIGSALMGKEGEAVGDTIADPTVRIEYDVFNWKNNREPNLVHTIARENHGPSNTKWQESYSYSDGSGGVMMTKMQAEPGKALRWNKTTQTVEEIDSNPRWIANGRTVLNNKGNPIKKYEPFFSTTPEYEDDAELVEIGFTPLLYYDPLGRNIRTEFANGTFTKSVFDAWSFTDYDVNDTVRDSSWYADRGSPDPDLDPEPADPERRSAWLAARHYDTPGIIHTNSLGAPFYGIADLGSGNTAHTHTETDPGGRYVFIFDQKDRRIAESYTNLLGSGIYSKTAEKGEQWSLVDVLGRPSRSWDNGIREYRATYDRLNRPAGSYLTEAGTEHLISLVVYADGLFSTATAAAMNMRGRPYRVYDQAGSITTTRVDFKGNPLQFERRLVKDYRARITDWKTLDGLNDLAAIDAASAALLEDESFTVGTELDALNRAVRTILPDGTIFQPIYNEANLLDSLQLQLLGQGDFLTFLESQDYDAKGQRQIARYSNGTVTQYTYDPRTYRLTDLLTRLANGDPDTQAIQNLRYTFDPIGNITQIRDDAQQTHFFANSVIYPENKYEYDAIYRLTRASGREHAGLGGNVQTGASDLPFISQLPHPNDSFAVRNYTELYDYDVCGNIRRQQHIATNANWTKRFQYSYEDDPADLTNRLKATSAPGDADGSFSLKYFHDNHGNMTSMPHLSTPDSMAWSFGDQLKEVDLGGGGTAYYVYGSGGNRVRKVIERPGGLIRERIYLGPLEIYRERQGDAPPALERHTIQVSDSTGRFAQIDIKTIDTGGADLANPLGAALVRYQYGNHLGSAMVETDGSGAVISYEEFHPFGTSSYRVSRSDVDLSLKRYRFGGKEHDDETGFYYFGARYYASWLGRWTSSDPSGFAGGPNLYSYCSNNPISFSDPTGMDEVSWQQPPSVSFTPGEAGKKATIDFINNHYVIGTVNGARYRFQVHVTNAEWVKGAEGKSFWQGSEYTYVGAEKIAEGEEVHEDETGFEPIHPAPPSQEIPEMIITPDDSDTAGQTGGSGTGTGTGVGAGNAPGNNQGTPSSSTDPSASSKNSSGRDASSVGGGVSLSGTGGEKFIWDYKFPNEGIGGSRRGQILEWMFGNTWRSNTAGWDIETPTSVQQIKSTSDYGGVGQIVRDATRDADAAITANPTGTMAGKRPQAVIVTPTDAPAAVDGDIANALGRARKPFTNNPLPPEHVRGLPGGWGTAARGLGIAGTGLSAISLGNDIRNGDVPMGVADTLSTAGGGLELYALYSAGATVGGVSAMSAGLVVGGAGIAIGSGISAYRAYKRGDTAGVVAGVIGVAAGLAIMAGVIFGAPLLLAAGIIAAIGVGLFHLGRWLFGD